MEEWEEEGVEGCDNSGRFEISLQFIVNSYWRWKTDVVLGRTRNKLYYNRDVEDEERMVAGVGE